MKYSFKKALALLISVIMILTSIILPSTAFAKDDEEKNYVEGEVIAVMKDSSGKTPLRKSNVSDVFGNGINLKKAFTFGTKEKTRVAVIKSTTLTTKQLLKQVKNNDAVKYAMPNTIKKASTITEDTFSQYQWALDNTGQNGGTVGDDINADALWDDAEQSENEQIVAIVDTGIDANHEDLKDVVWTNPYGSKLLGEHGMDFTSTIESGEPVDDNGHGTHCAGIIAAQANNNKGISGVNTSNTKIMALKFLDEDGSGDLYAALAAYDYIIRAVNLGANVVACNNSWGGGGTLEELELLDLIYDTMGELGVITFAAANNSATDISEPVDDDWFGTVYDTPACCTSPYCITVAATTGKDELADFSNYSKTVVDIAAPGTEILSSVSYDCFNPSIYTNTQKAERCAYMQEYNSPISTDTFGYPKFVQLDESNFGPGGSDYTITQGVEGFGLDGQAIQIKLNDEVEEESMCLYAFEFPYTLEDVNKDYSISVMSKGNNNFEALVFDLPASFDDNKVVGEFFEDLYLFGAEAGNCWDHRYADKTTKDYGYKKSTDRKLLMIAISYKKGTTITLDDLAISSQSANKSDFGKYDYYCGTSMATPYATGAAALIKNAKPEATTLDIINIIKNTGRYSEALADKTQNGKVLSLDNINNMPPMIAKAEYDDNGDVMITGSFKSITKVTADGVIVTPKEADNNTIIIPDANYNTKRTTFKVSNAYGSDEYTAFLSSKPEFNVTLLDTAPNVNGGFAVNAGENAYFVSSEGMINAVGYDEYEKSYFCYELGCVDWNEIFGELGAGFITAAAFRSNKLYLTGVVPIYSEYSGAIIGYETAFLYYNIDTSVTKLITTDIPDTAIYGGSLAVYKGKIFLLGGMTYKTDKYDCYDTMYRFNESTNAFDKLKTKLPEGRAYSNYVQYKDKLIGVYGVNDTGTLPQIIVFDGNSWTKSSVNLTSDNYYDFGTTKIYYGNLGYGNGGVFMNGAYVYGIGDSFTYNVDTDKITACKNSYKNSFNTAELVGTTVPGGFIGFAVNGYSDDEDEDEYAVGGLNKTTLALVRDDDYPSDDILVISGNDDDDDDEEYSEAAYTLTIKNSYPEIDSITSLSHAYNYKYVPMYTVYGDKVKLDMRAETGYYITSIKANGKTLSTNSKTASFVVSGNTTISNTVKLVASKITKVKLSKFSSGKATLKWSKPKHASGYQVQKYVNGKWKTIKTIKKASTTTYKTGKLSVGATTKYRVRTYGKYNGTTLYGEAGYKKLYRPKKQSITSLKGAKKAFTVKVKKEASATGYQIVYSKKKSFKSSKKTTMKSSNTSKKVTGLKKGKYYVKVRSYKTVDGKRIYGAYSKVKTVKVK